MLRSLSLFVLTLMSAVHVGETHAAVAPKTTGDEGSITNADRDGGIVGKPRTPPAVTGVRG